VSKNKKNITAYRNIMKAAECKTRGNFNEHVRLRSSIKNAGWQMSSKYYQFHEHFPLVCKYSL